ncbi:MAG: hypothetical protein AAF741_15710 [Bacteroidota bacterium]
MKISKKRALNELYIIQGYYSEILLEKHEKRSITLDEFKARRAALDAVILAISNTPKDTFDLLTVWPSARRSDRQNTLFGSESEGV